MIQFEQVTYTYPNAIQPALHDVSLRIAEGDFVLVVGVSGSGKSTFLRCLNGLVPHFYGGQFGGRVLVDGRDTRSHEPRDLASTVGFVFQDPEAQMVVEIVEDEIVFGMENMGIAPQIMRRRVEEVLDQLEIAHLRRRRVTTLSGGERQRVAIAAVLALQPRVLVLDEPTSQLDPHTAEEVLTALHKLNADLGLTVVLSEHRLERVVQYADQMIVFDQRADQPRIVQGAPRDVLAHSQLAPPLVELGRALGWQPLPLTIKEGRQIVLSHGLDHAPSQSDPSPVLAQPDQIRAPFKLRRRPTQAAPPAPALRVDQISVRFSATDVLHNVDFALPHGAIVAIMGRNGSGKTTLLRTIMGLLAPTHGRVLLGSTDLSHTPTEDRAGTIGYVPQDPRTLLFQETVADELRWTLKQQLPSAERAEIEARVQATLDRFGLAERATTHPRDLSGGEQQRAALAAVLVADPTILLLDEPTRGLDYLHKGKLIELLDQLRHANHAIALVTHDVELVAACADQVVLLGNGEVVVSGSPHQILNESLIFSSQIGKLFRHQPWLTVREALAALTATVAARS